MEMKKGRKEPTPQSADQVLGKRAKDMNTTEKKGRNFIRRARRQLRITYGNTNLDTLEKAYDKNDRRITGKVARMIELAKAEPKYFNERYRLKVNNIIARKQANKRDINTAEDAFIQQHDQDVDADLEFKSLVILDDWGTLLTLLAPIGLKYGSKAFSWLWQKAFGQSDTSQEVQGDVADLAGRYVSKYGGFGDDTGFNGDDIKTMLTPQSKESHPLVGQYSRNAVSREALATWICPEDYAALMPVETNMQPAVSYRYSFELPVLTDANGNWFMSLSYHALAAAAGNAGFIKYCVNNAAQQFNPTTGVYASLGQGTLAGPLWAASGATVRSLLQVGFSTELIPIDSLLNASGLVEVMRYNAAINDTYNAVAALNPVTTSTEVVNSPGYTRANGRTTIRTIFAPNDLDDFIYVDYSDVPNPAGGLPMNHGEYWLLTGYPVLTTVANIKFTAVGNYVPLASQAGLIVPRLISGFSATQSAQSSILGILPGLQRFNLVTARSLAAHIMDCKSCDHDAILQCVSHWLRGNNVSVQNSINTSVLLSGRQNPTLPPELLLRDEDDDLAQYF